MWQLLLQLAPADGAGGESEYAERVTAALRTVGLQPSEVERIGQAFTEALRQAPQREDGDRLPLSVRIWIKGLPAAVDPSESGPEDQDVRRRNRGGWGFFLLERREDEPGTTEGKAHRIIELYLYRESSSARKTRSETNPKWKGKKNENL